MNKFFNQIARRVAELMGYATTFTIAAGVVLVWALAGPLFGFSDTWQLVINTSTTIITFLMVFIIQNTQNRDNLAFHAKLDGLLEKLTNAEGLQRIEEASEPEIKKQRKRHTK